MQIRFQPQAYTSKQNVSKQDASFGSHFGKMARAAKTDYVRNSKQWAPHISTDSFFNQELQKLKDKIDLFRKYAKKERALKINEEGMAKITDEICKKTNKAPLYQDPFGSNFYVGKYTHTPYVDALKTTVDILTTAKSLVNK